MIETTSPLPSLPRANARAIESVRSPSQLEINLSTVGVLLARDLRRFFRQRSRVVGALLQPLIFWLVIGSGLDKSFVVPGEGRIGYLQYFYPGIILLVLLFTSIFTTMSVIEDRQRGFLQAVLVAPASRTALVLGKTLGGVAIATTQAAIFLCLLPFAGFSIAHIYWLPLLVSILATSIGLSSVGFAIAWWLDSTQGYHVVMSVLLIPLWILSGAMFTLHGAAPWIGWIMRVKPMAYGLAAIRRGLYGTVGISRGGLNALDVSMEVELAVVLGFAAVALGWAVWMCRTRNAKHKRPTT